MEIDKICLMKFFKVWIFLRTYGGTIKAGQKCPDMVSVMKEEA